MLYEVITAFAGRGEFAALEAESGNIAERAAFPSAPNRTMGYGKMEGDKDDRAIAYIIERDSYSGPAYHQEWYGMKPTTPIISGGMNALRLPGFFENLGHGSYNFV